MTTSTVFINFRRNNLFRVSLAVGILVCCLATERNTEFPHQNAMLIPSGLKPIGDANGTSEAAPGQSDPDCRIANNAIWSLKRNARYADDGLKVDWFAENLHPAQCKNLTILIEVKILQHDIESNKTFTCSSNDTPTVCQGYHLFRYLNACQPLRVDIRFSLSDTLQIAKDEDGWDSIDIQPIRLNSNMSTIRTMVTEKNTFRIEWNDPPCLPSLSDSDYWNIQFNATDDSFIKKQMSLPYNQSRIALSTHAIELNHTQIKHIPCGNYSIQVNSITENKFVLEAFKITTEFIVTNKFVVQNLTATNVTSAGFSLQWIMMNKCRESEKLNSTRLEVQMNNRTWNVFDRDENALLVKCTEEYCEVTLQCQENLIANANYTIHVGTEKVLIRAPFGILPDSHQEKGWLFSVVPLLCFSIIIVMFLTCYKLFCRRKLARRSLGHREEFERIRFGKLIED